MTSPAEASVLYLQGDPAPIRRGCPAAIIRRHAVCHALAEFDAANSLATLNKIAIVLHRDVDFDKHADSAASLSPDGDTGDDAADDAGSEYLVGTYLRVFGWVAGACNVVLVC